MANKRRLLGTILVTLVLLGADLGLLVAAGITVVVHWPVYLIPVFVAAGFGLGYAAWLILHRGIRKYSGPGPGKASADPQGS